MLKPLNKDAEIIKHRRNLPSWQQPGCTYFITWRLGDSLPADKLKAWNAARDAFRQAHPEPDWSDEVWEAYRREITQPMEAHLDAGHGTCVLRRPDFRAHVTRALHHFAGIRYQLGAYAIMPNHVHVLLTPVPDESLSAILQSLKRHTAREINRQLDQTGTSLWQEESFHHAVRSEPQLLKFQNYIRNNPTKARLAPDTFTLGNLPT